MAKALHVSSPMFNLTVSPLVALVDETVCIKVTGLTKHQPITVAAYIKEGTAVYISHGQYTANELGVVDLTTDVSTGGSYEGLEPMGLFWAMFPADGERLGMRLMKKDVTTPFKININVRQGHIKCTTKKSFDSPVGLLGSLVVERWYKAPDVKRIEVRSGKLRGSLFLPSGKSALLRSFSFYQEITFIKK